MTQSGDFDYPPGLPAGFAGHGDGPVDTATFHDFVAGGINHLRDQSGQVLASWHAASASQALGPSDNPPGVWHEAARVPLVLRLRPDGYTHGLIVHLRVYNAGTGGDVTSAQWRWYLLPGQENWAPGIQPSSGYAARDQADATVAAGATTEWLTGDGNRSLRLTPRDVAFARQLSFRVASNRAETAFGRVRPVLAYLVIGVAPEGTANIDVTLRGYHIREFDTGTI